MNHFTDKKGYNAIRATVAWCFKAQRQRSKTKPFGAYFTTLMPTVPNLAKRLRLRRRKCEFVFMFVDAEDLTPLPGPRGKGVFYSPTDYFVAPERQPHAGKV
jgi:hypothetical protein